MELSDAIFGIEPNKAVMHSAVVKLSGQPAPGAPSPPSPGARSPAAARSRGARRAPAAPARGSTRAPQWTTAVSFGPKPAAIRYTLPKKVIAPSWRHEVGLLLQGGRGEMLVLDGLAFEEIKTKTWRDAQSPGGHRKKVSSSCRKRMRKRHPLRGNIPGVKTALVNTLNVYDILGADKFIVAQGRRRQDRGGVQIMEARDIILAPRSSRKKGRAGSGEKKYTFRV